MENEPTIVRDDKGRLKKGSVLNPKGPDWVRARMKRDLEGLTPRAIARLGRLIESDNEPVALGAVKEVLDRNLGKVKQGLDVSVTHSHQLHLEALKELAERAKRPQVIDVTPIPTQGNLMQDADGRVALTIEGAGVAADPPGGEPPHPAASAAAPTPPTTKKTDNT